MPVKMAAGKKSTRKSAPTICETFAKIQKYSITESNHLV